MNISALFIHRPVATSLLTVGIFLSGALAMGLLPVAPLPQVDFPTISVSANLPGASPETMAATVSTPLERALGRIDGVTEITSDSSLGSSRVTLQFNLDKNIDEAAREVQAAINASRAMLPTSLPGNPTYRKVNPADTPIMILSLTSDTLTQGQMYDAAATVLAQRLAQVEGVGQVSIGGGALPAVRVELRLPQLAQLNLGLEEVRQALVNANPNRPKGFVEDEGKQWQVLANDQAKNAADYRALIVSYRNKAAIRLGDVASVEDSVQDVRNAGAVNGKPAILLTLNRQPGANILEAVDRVKKLLPALRTSIPASIDLGVMMERTASIRSSLHEVERALAFSVLLVVAVVFVFLRSTRATLIPAVAVPVSLAGTLAVMWACGFSLNNLSLMALTVATGFVVDDAVVVLENIVRRIEAGEQPFQAALTGSREVAFTVLSMSVSLVAVFIPVLAMGGIVGRLFREFAVTLTAAILVSLAVSLIVTPMMCARLLKAPRREENESASRFANLKAAAARWQATLLAGYGRSLDWSLRHPARILAILAATIGLNVWLYTVIPKGFLPRQDIGFIVGNINGDQSVSFQAMDGKIKQLVDIIRADAAVENVGASITGSRRNHANVWITLKPLAERRKLAQPSSIFDVIARLRPLTSHVAGATLSLNPAQDIRIGGRESSSEWQFTLTADELDDLRKWEPKVRHALAALPQVSDVNTDMDDKAVQTTVTIDREAAAKLGIPVRLLTATLNDAFGQRQVSTIYQPLNQYKVVMEGAPDYWQHPQSLDQIWIVAADGRRVPFPAIAKWAPGATPLRVSHQSGFAASTVSFDLAPGVTLGAATDAVDAMFAKIGMPDSVRGGFQGTARAFQSSLASQPLLILAALVAIYLVLGMLYESTLHPLTILSTLPSAGVGALLALMACGLEFSVIALIGIILLIGIVKKNAIMMVDVALAAEREQGLAPRDAIRHACLLRFRPIMMTTLAAMLGAVPLALGTGDGAELRQPLGIAVVGGLLVSQVLTLYTTPVVYLVLDRARHATLRRLRRAPAFSSEVA
ncbi:MAG: efflux RND transporter permease subunit [Rhodocyclales bacterium]|nr:efflux RND transporter permease subunit [Rhodocyclales bacterium]